MAGIKIFIVFMTLFALAGPVAATPSDAPPLKRVLVLTRTTVTEPWTAEFIRELTARPLVDDYRFEYRVITIAADRRDTHDNAEFFTVRPAIAAAEFDLVLALDDAAVELMLEYYYLLPQTVPLVFVGYRGCTPELRDRYANLTGIAGADNLNKTIAAGLKLLPATEEVVILTGSSDQNRRLRAHQLKTVGKTPVYTFLNTVPYDAPGLRARLRQLSGNAFLVLTRGARLRDGSAVAEAIFGGGTAAGVNLNCFTTTGECIGRGALGGYITRAEEQVNTLSALVSDLFIRNDPAAVAVVRGEATPVFDYELLRRRRLRPTVLPENTIFIHRPEQLWSIYQTELAVVATVLLLGLGFGFLHWRTSRRHTRRMMAIFNALPAQICVVDRVGRILFRHGTEFRDTATMSFEYLMEVPDLPAETLMSAIHEVFISGVPQTVAYQHGQIKRSMTASLLPENIFKQGAVICVAYDSSELQDALNSQSLTAERLAVTLRSIGEGVVATDERGLVTLLNPSAARLLGVSEDAALGRNLSEIFTVADTPGTPIVARALAHGETTALADDAQIRRPDGAMLRVAAAAAAMRRGDAITGAVVVFRDTSAAYEQRNQLNFTLATLQLAGRMAQMGYFIYDLASRTFENLSDNAPLWPRDRRGVPLAPEKWVHPSDLPQFEAAWKLADRGVTPTLNLTFKAQHQGALRYFKLLTAALDRPGRPPAVLGVLQEITDITVSRQQYEDATALMHSMLEEFGCPISIRDTTDDFRLVLVNKSFARLWGVTPAAALHRDDADLFGAAAAEFHANDLRALAAGRLEGVLESFTDADRRPRTMITNRSVLQRGDGHRLIVGISVDVTEREESRRKEAEARKFIATVLEHIPAGIFIKDPDNDFRYLAWNRELTRQTGIPAAEAVGHTDAELRFHRDRAEQYHQGDIAAIAATEAVPTTETLTLEDGRTVINTILKMPIVLENGKQLLLGMITDITARHRLEEEREAMILRLNNYIESERIITRALSQLVLGEGFAKTVQETFLEIAAQINCDRVCFGCYGPDGTFQVISEHFQTGFAPLQGTLTGPIIKQFQQWRPHFERNASIRISDISASEYAAIFASTGVHSLIAAPVFVNGKFFGVVGAAFHQHARQFSELDEKVARSTGRIIALAWMHEQHHAELNAAHREKMMILDTLQIPLGLYDAEGVLLRANPAADALVKLSRPADIGKPGLIFYSENHVPSDNPVQSAIRTGQTATAELTLYDHEYIVTAIPVFDADHRLQNIVGSAVDVTEINATRRQLETALNAAQAAEEAKNYFFAAMSHELRTPLNAVIGFSELLRNEQLTPEERQDYLQSIHFSSSALLRLINDILHLSQLEYDQLVVTPEPTELRSLLKESAALFAPEAAAKKLALGVSSPDGLPLLNLDALRLRQVLFNLLGNAIKFTEKGSVLLQADFASQPDGRGTLTLQVRDTGIGIAPEDREKIFTPFTRRKGIKTTDSAGLGLLIVRRLLAKMNGTLTLTGTLGVGSTFSVTLPNLVVTQPTIATTPPPIATILPPPADRVPTALLVDDVPINLRVLEALLKNMGFQCRTANSAVAALQQLEEAVPDYLLTDIWMPGISGAELAALLRRESRFNALRIIAVTADIEVQANFPDHHFDAILLKPVTLDKLQNLFKAYQELQSYEPQKNNV